MGRLAVLVAFICACSFQAREASDGGGGGPTCGNGVLDPGEACDTGIPGSCPTSCDDGVGCTADSLEGTDCAAMCRHDAITTAHDGDGCCPAGATSDTDNDCSVTCGNGTVESNETCDTAIMSGPGACPTSCDDGMVCTTDALVSGGTCNAACTFTQITTAMSGDGCCPAGATYATDTDCPPPPTAFRVTSLQLRDPHPFVSFMNNCNDTTNFTNNAEQAGIDNDFNNDGYYDTSFVLVFRPLVQTNNGTTPTDLYTNALCTKTATTCKPGSNAPYSATATSLTATTCLTTVASTTHPYNPAVSDAAAPCFGDSAVDMTLPILGSNVPLKQVQVAGTFSGTTSVTTGLLRGFLTQADAQATAAPGGGTIADQLADGQGSCPGYSDMDMNGATKGWWVYLNFTATAEPWSDQ